MISVPPIFVYYYLKSAQIWYSTTSSYKSIHISPINLHYKLNTILFVNIFSFFNILFLLDINVRGAAKHKNAAPLKIYKNLKIILQS